MRPVGIPILEQQFQRLFNEDAFGDTARVRELLQPEGLCAGNANLLLGRASHHSLNKEYSPGV